MAPLSLLTLAQLRFRLAAVFAAGLLLKLRAIASQPREPRAAWALKLDVRGIRATTDWTNHAVHAPVFTRLDRRRLTRASLLDHEIRG
jgi:hypothetical protein